MAARVERSGLDRAGRYPGDLGNLVDRLLVIVDEFEDFAVGR